MSEEKKSPITVRISAEELKAVVSERGEKTLAEILAAARGFKNGLSGRMSASDEGAAQPKAANADADRQELQSAAEITPPNGEAAAQSAFRGVETVEYRAPEIVRAAENAVVRGIDAHKTPAERRQEVRMRTAQRHGAALLGKSRREQMDTIRRLSDEAAEELPERFYEKLSGGIALSEAKKYHPKSQSVRPLLILGEYRNDPHLGRSIMLYGGSIIETYGHLSEDALKNELRRIIRHEFTHHIESLCGERGLEVEDARELEKYEWELSNTIRIDAPEDVR